jgi:hypothetical protein
VLGDRHFGVAVRHAANRRGEAALAIRQHFIIGHQLNAAKLHAVENVAARKGIANPQQAFDVTSGRAVARCSVNSSAGLVILHRRDVTQTPGPEVNPAA